jgi:hypothetical protein
LRGLFYFRSLNGASRPFERPEVNWRQRRPDLLNLGLFVDYVLARDRIEFLHLDLVRGRALVFVRGVEMARAGRRLKFDFFSHDRPP